MLTIKRKDNNNKQSANNGTNGGPAQGITGGRSILRRLAIQALGIVIVPLCVGFAYLLLLREPALQATQADRISIAFAERQAAGIGQFQQRFRERIQSAAGSGEARGVLEATGPESLANREQALAQFFPDAVSLHILPIGEMGTAPLSEGDRGLRNHIELDLVRRASEGQETLPESFKYEQRWLTSFAQRIDGKPAEGQKAVMLVTIDNQRFVEQLTAAASSSGRFDLEQVFAPGGRAGQGVIIASTGAGEEERFQRNAEVPDTTWRVVFTPSSALVNAVTISPIPVIVVLIAALVAAIVGLYLLMSRFSSALSGEAAKVLAAADQKSALELELPELVPLAKQLRRVTQRSSRPRTVATGSQVTAATHNGNGAAATAKPAAGSEQEPGGASLELDLADELALDLAGNSEPDGLPAHIFRAYDIRGLADTELTDELVTGIGKAIGTLAGEREQQSLIVGCDGRASSSRIKSALIRALMESGRDVIDIGTVPTPLLYYATRHLACNSGVMITGSHNPAEFNGFKIVIDQQTIAAGGIQEILETIRSGKFSSGQGRTMREDIVSAYIDEVVADIAIAVPLKIVVDAGNGATSEIAPLLFEELGCEVVPLHCELDGSFPNHPPDTSNEANLQDLVEAVRTHGADLGVAFDGDGDRLAVVSGSGAIVRSDVLLMIYAEDVVSRNPGADVVFDVKCSRNLTQLITQHGGRPVLWKTGHAFMKEKMAETGALLGGEFSGHIFFGERWYGFDDGMYAAGRLAEILSTRDASIDETIAALPASVNTPEILIPILEQDKFHAIENIVSSADFPTGKTNTLDGLRVDFADGWGLVRASNTSPALTARFEASTEEGLREVMASFKSQIESAEPELQLPF